MDFKRLYILTQREFVSLFSTMTAIMVTTILMFLYGLFFFINITYGQSNDLTNVFSVVLWFCGLLSPMVAIKLIAEERRLGVFDFLLSAPVNVVEIVLSKYISVVILFCCFLLVVFFGAVYLDVKSDFYWSRFLLQVGGLFLFNSVMLSIGLYMSSLTSNPIMANILAVFTSIFLLIMSSLSGAFGAPWGALLKELSPVVHFQNFNKGLFDVKDVVYFISFIILMLLLCMRNVETIRHRQ